MRRFWHGLILAALLWGILSGSIGAAGPAPVPSDNGGRHDYRGYAAQPVYSYLMEEESGGMTRVEYTGKEITVEAYNRTGDILSQQNLPVELPLFGGFYSGEQYNFLVFGQENPEEDNGREVIRVVRYRKDWKRMDDARLLGANTVTPFHTGSLSMVQCGDMLYIRTSHKMYRSQNDGLHHQANLTFSVRISTMEVTDQHTAVSRFGFGYVSHSFNQFLTCRGTTLLAADHGDAYPRAVVLSRCAKPGGEETFSGYADTVEVLPIQGEIGDNRTGVSVGGLEATATSYLVAGCSVDQTGENHRNGVRNIFVTSTPANDFTQAATEVRWMTSFEEEDLGGASNPYLVKLGEDRLLLLWEAQGELQYGVLDGTGKLQGTIYHASGRLSDCQPVVMEGAVWWYCTAGGGPVFYRLDPDTRQVECLNGQVTVTLDPRGGTVSPTTVTVTYGAAYGPLPEPVRLDYAFAGWYLDQGAVQLPVTEDTQVTVGESHTLYAQWTPAPHTHLYESVVTPPGCEEEGYTTYTCTLCEDSYRDAVTPALGHSYGPEICKQPPTCTEPGVQVRTCTRCGHSQRETVEALGHAYDQGTVTQAPSCTSPGIKAYTCTRCGSQETEALPPLPHRYGELVTPPTCTEEGYTTHTCTVCGDQYVDCYVNSRGHSWDRGRVTAPPTETASGVRTWLCTRCGDNRTEAIGPWPNPFVDVTQERYYYTPVRWAADAGVTAGVDSTHFAPGSTCTRGQVVTFLWRAYGCPAPKSAQCPFGDVSPQRYYYQAVLWAAEQRITDGVDATHFAPDRTVTRGQLVTFLWRAEGCPTGVGTNPFADVERGRFYYDAVLWAAKAGITTGVDATHFRPNQSCTRGQVATFLYREFAE